MNRTAQTSIVLASLLAAVMPARATGPMKVWVAGTGSDLNPCTLAQPCRTFQHAHDTLAPGGEISVLTPGDYGPLSISMAVSVTNDGAGEAGVYAGPPSEIAAIYISANRGDVIGLRGLIIDGQGVGLEGIAIFGVSAVHIQNSVVRNFSAGGFCCSFGIAFTVQTSTQLFVSDTAFYNNGEGILIASQLADSSANVVLDRVHLDNNVVGLFVNNQATVNTLQVVLRDSIVSGNDGDGIHVQSVAGRPALLVVEHTAVVNNAGTGLVSDGPHAIILLGGNSIKRNGTGINAINGGQLISYGNNRNNNNFGAEGVATSTFTPF